jgi:hypothetical protein
MEKAKTAWIIGLFSADAACALAAFGAYVYAFSFYVS